MGGKVGAFRLIQDKRWVMMVLLCRHTCSLCPLASSCGPFLPHWDRAGIVAQLSVLSLLSYGNPCLFVSSFGALSKAT